jgi:excisionase family DNA binding protein
MATIHPEVIGRRSGVTDHTDNLEPLAVSPRQACLLLGVGNTRLYQLIGNGELDTYREGRARRITTESIKRRVAHLLAVSNQISAHIEAALPRRRGRPPKASAAVQRRLDQLTSAQPYKPVP